MWGSRGGAVWTAEDVCGLGLPEHSLRTYLEQTDLRLCLQHAAELFPLRRLADVGAGFGRLTPVLAECGEVVAFEREREMVATGRRLQPDVTWHEVARLDRLPVVDSAVDLALTFTVLQHLSDDEAARVVAELRRIVGRPGAVLICEEVDPSHQWRPAPPDPRFTIGRSVDRYEKMLAPFRLVERWPRRTEPTGAGHIPGEEAFLLFVGR